MVSSSTPLINGSPSKILETIIAKYTDTWLNHGIAWLKNEGDHFEVIGKTLGLFDRSQEEIQQFCNDTVEFLTAHRYTLLSHNPLKYRDFLDRINVSFTRPKSGCNISIFRS